MDNKFVIQQLIMEITDQIEELEKRKSGYLKVKKESQQKLADLQEMLRKGQVS